MVTAVQQGYLWYRCSDKWWSLSLSQQWSNLLTEVRALCSSPVWIARNFSYSNEVFWLVATVCATVSFEFFQLNIPCGINSQIRCVLFFSGCHWKTKTGSSPTLSLFLFNKLTMSCWVTSPLMKKIFCDVTKYFQNPFIVHNSWSLLFINVH